MESETPEVEVMPSASCTVEGEREAGREAEVSTVSKLKAVGASLRSGARVPSLLRAEWRVVMSSEGSSGAEPDKKPTDFRASLWRSTSRRRSPPVPALVCFLSPVRSWRHWRFR